jgi:hypothetical protein
MKLTVETSLKWGKCRIIKFIDKLDLFHRNLGISFKLDPLQKVEFAFIKREQKQSMLVKFCR